MAAPTRDRRTDGLGVGTRAGDASADCDAGVSVPNVNRIRSAKFL